MYDVYPAALRQACCHTRVHGGVPHACPPGSVMRSRWLASLKLTAHAVHMGTHMAGAVTWRDSIFTACPTPSYLLPSPLLHALVVSVPPSRACYSYTQLRTRLPCPPVSHGPVMRPPRQLASLLKLRHWLALVALVALVAWRDSTLTACLMMPPTHC